MNLLSVAPERSELAEHKQNYYFSEAIFCFVDCVKGCCCYQGYTTFSPETFRVFQVARPISPQKNPLPAYCV